MAAKLGRVATLTWNGVALGGVMEKNFKINGDPVDISSDDSAGWRELIETEVNLQSVDLDVNGVTKDEQLFTDWFAKNFTGDLIFTMASGAIIAGRFFLTGLSKDGPFNDAVKYQASFQSTGTVTYTPAP